MTTVVKLGVRVVDGECLPVPGVEVGARYRYEDHPSTWDTEVTDGDGMAWFVDEHSEDPSEVSLYVGDSLYGTFPVEDGSTLILEV